jgi:hypothetical protein
MHQHITKQPLQFGKLQAVIVLLVFITAGLHVYLATQPDEELRLWFLLNGLGYPGLVLLLYLTQTARFRVRIRGALVVYTGLTIVLWFFLGDPGAFEPLGITTKGVEVLLVAFLILEDQLLPRHRQRRASAS